MLDEFDYNYAETEQRDSFDKFYCTVRGDYLEWVENQLIVATEDPTINRIIVVGHVPILSFDNSRYSSDLVYRDVPGENGENSILMNLL